MPYDARDNAEGFGYVPMLDELAEWTHRIPTTERQTMEECTHASKCINY